MIEKVNPSHPDKLADRIAGALVDLAYTKNARPKIAVEVLIGHGVCHIIAETSEKLSEDGHTVGDIVRRITKDPKILIDYEEVPQDAHLAANQAEEPRCGDNGIFKGVPLNDEEKTLTTVVHNLYEALPSDGKFIWSEADEKFIACQSNATHEWLEHWFESTPAMPKGATVIINPLGEWTGGPDVDTGATNRKLGSDMGRAVTGGGLHGKDLSKADVAVNIACHLMAQETGQEVSALCAIGDDVITFVKADREIARCPYDEVLAMAGDFINDLGGFEKLAEWGLF